jgi:paraquat-inducible protein B
VVKPRFFAGAISGIETLLSGSYIELQPSAAGGTPKRDFIGLEDPPVLQSGIPGHTFLLQATRIGSISLGSPIFYRDFTVGEVLGWDIGDMAESVTVHAFVRAPFDAYVHDGSRFWNASGVSLKLGPNGLQLQLESLRAVVLGGIAFDTPTEARVTPVSGENHKFRLYADQQDADAAAFTRRIPCIAYFDGSVSGLSPDAAVTLHGIPVGQVESVGLQYDKSVDRVLVPVRFEVEPQRVGNMPILLGSNVQAQMAELVHRGLRVRLESASLITGQKQLTLDYLPTAPEATLRMEGDSFVIPVLTSGGGDLASSAGALMAKLSAIPFEQIGDNLNKTLQGTGDIANSPDLKQSIAMLQKVLAGVQDLVARLNAGVDPALQRLPAISAELEDTVRRINKLVGSADTGYGGNSQFNRDADRLLVQLTDTARSVRVLSDLLTRHPEALIRGRTEQGP